MRIETLEMEANVRVREEEHRATEEMANPVCYQQKTKMPNTPSNRR